MSRNSATRNLCLSSMLRLPALLRRALACAALCGLVALGQAPRRQVRRRPAPAPQQRPAQQRPAPQRSAPAEASGHNVAAPNAMPSARTTPAPIVRVAPSVSQTFPQNTAAQAVPQKPAPASGTPNRTAQTQLHIAPWMQAHGNLPLAEQQRALDNEPGFRNFPPQEQERLHQQLTHLNALPPDQRARQIQKIESLERMAPPQRKQVINAMSELGSLREDRREAVARAFHSSLAMPPQQRQAYLNSPQFRSQYSENERETVNHLLQIQPAAAQAGFDWARPPAPPVPHD